MSKPKACVIDVTPFDPGTGEYGAEAYEIAPYPHKACTCAEFCVQDGTRYCAHSCQQCGMTLCGPCNGYQTGAQLLREAEQLIKEGY